MEMIWRDLRHGLRALRKSPGFSAIVVLLLALGVGANTAIFSVVSAVILRPLPYPSADRLVMLPAAHRPNAMGEEVAPANFLDWRRENRSFERLGAFGPASVNLTGGRTPERVQGAVITPGGLAALGARPLYGRLFLPDEERPDSRVALLSYGLWKSHFAADPGVIGKVVRLSGFEYPIVGVMPPEFRFPRSDVRIWMPLRITETRAKDRQSRWLYIFGRLRDGVSLSAARREMDGLTRALGVQHPENGKDWGVRVVPLRDHLVGRVRPTLLILLTTTLLVLIIACANIANLQLARAAARRREMAIRSAMGASASAVLRQLLIEGSVLSALGGTFGIVLAQWTLHLLIASSSRSVPRLEEIGIDGRVLLFAVGLSVLTGVIFALVPARSALKADVLGDLREGGRGASSGVGQIRFRRLLTAAEVATALVLLIGAGLLLSSLARLQTVEPGFNSDNVLTMEIVLPAARYSDNLKRAAFFRELVQRAAQVPGVQRAAGVANLPLSGSNATEGYVVERQPAPDPNDLPEAGYRGVTPGYFQALQVPVLQGRDFSERDTEPSPRVVVVNKTFAQRWWPGESAVGKRLRLSEAGGTSHEVIGVVGDIRHTRLDVPTVPEIYVCYEQHDFDNIVLVVRSRSDPTALGRQLRAEVEKLDPEQPVFNMRTLARVLEESTSEPKFYTTVLSAFAALALVLSTLGIYSVISYSVAQRRHELAIRVALGAQRGDLLALVVGEGMVVAAAGIFAGLVLAWAATRGLSSLLFGVEPDDPLIFAATAALLAGVAVAASLIPALRASRVSPVNALQTP
jgi:putative ABC transport system permease protein